MSIINAIFATVIGGILAPFASLPSWVGLAVVSALVGVLALLVYKYTSDQTRIARVKDQIVACLFEIRLFRDDMRAVFGAQGEIMRHNLFYLGLNLVPLAVMIVPFVFIAAQLQAEYGYEPLKVGEDVLVTVELEESAANAAKPDVALDTPAGLVAETGPVWIPSERQLVWRVSAASPGDYELGVTAGGERYTKEIRSSQVQQRRSPIRQVPQFIGQLLYPAEDTLPKDGPLRSISVDYPDREISFLGLELNWIFWFFVMSVAAGFSLRGPMKVTI